MYFRLLLICIVIAISMLVYVNLNQTNKLEENSEQSVGNGASDAVVTDTIKTAVHEEAEKKQQTKNVKLSSNDSLELSDEEIAARNLLLSEKTEEYREMASEYDLDLSNSEARDRLTEALVEDEDYKNGVLEKFKLERNSNNAVER